MKKFIAVLTFSMLFFAGKADTISRVHVYLNDSLIYDAYQGEVIRIKLRFDPLNSTDTLRFENYFGCGGAPKPNQYTFILSDPEKGIHLYENAPYLSPDFSFSLGILKELTVKDPKLRTITGWYRLSTSQDVTSGIRFVIELKQ